MLKFFKTDYKKLYAKEREARWSLERDYNIVVSAHQNLLTDYYKLKDELEEERYNHDRLQDYAVEMDKREETLKAQIRELRSFYGANELAEEPGGEDGEPTGEDGEPTGEDGEPTGEDGEPTGEETV